MRLCRPLLDEKLGGDSWALEVAEVAGVSAIDEPHRAALLLNAAECFRLSGELREELLPFLWDPLGLHRDEFGAVLQQLCKSGVLFLAEHTELGRRWVMPLRLPDVPPETALKMWSVAGRATTRETLGITYAFGDEAPPGVVERLVAACSGVGDYTGYWKRGAILETSLNKTLVLVELRDRLVEPTVLVKDKRIKVPDADPIREVELAIELRGPKSMRSELWGLALMLKSRADTLLAEWPEIETEAEMRCPSCLSSGTEPCPSWPADAEKRAERMCPIVPTCPECGSLVDLVGVAADEERYRAPSLRMPPDIERSLQSNPPPFKLGHPIQASWSLSRVLGVDKKFLEQVLALDTADRLAAIAGEIRELGCDEADAHGWTDGDWLSYLMESEASEAPLPAGMPSDVLDYGHRGMNLEAFTNHPMAVAAGLDKAHVLALRLATSTAFVRLTAPLFVGCQPSPHPYPTTVALLNEAICALQAAQQQQAAEDDDPGPTLWRGVSNLEVSTELLQRGGTIIAPTAFSTSSSVAKESAAGSHHMDFPFPPAILKVRMEGGMTACDVRFLSCFPREAMYLLPPGTYLHCAGNDPKPKEEWDGLELGLEALPPEEPYGHGFVQVVLNAIPLKGAWVPPTDPTTPRRLSGGGLATPRGGGGGITPRRLGLAMTPRGSATPRGVVSLGMPLQQADGAKKEEEAVGLW